jgi:hypothetical protein
MVKSLGNCTLTETQSHKLCNAIRRTTKNKLEPLAKKRARTFAKVTEESAPEMSDQRLVVDIIICKYDNTLLMQIK